MKRTVKKKAPLTEPLIEQEKTRGKNISVYLNAEALTYLDKLCVLYQMGRSEVIQDMIIRTKKTALQLIPLLDNDKSPLADAIRKIGLG